VSPASIDQTAYRDDLVAPRGAAPSWSRRPRRPDPGGQDVVPSAHTRDVAASAADVVPVCGQTSGQPSVTGCSAHRSFGWGPPFASLANRSNRGPADTVKVQPLTSTMSSDNVRGDRPPSTAAMTTGQASSVDWNRARTLLDGISRSWYPTAPSMKISTFSPGLRVRRPTSARLQSTWLVSGRMSSASTRIGWSAFFVFTAFALRGAPCGNDARPPAAFGRYHEKQSTSDRVSDGLRAMLRPQTRLYSITGYGGDVERLLDRTSAWT